MTSCCENQLAADNMGLLYAAVKKHRRYWPDGDYDEAVSVAQPAYLAALRTHDPLRGSLSTHVYTRVVGALLDHQRHMAFKCRAVKPCRFEHWMESGETEPSPLEICEAAETPGWFMRLSEEMQDMIRLRVMGQTFQQIASMHSLSRTTVYTRFAEMRECLCGAT